MPDLEYQTPTGQLPQRAKDSDQASNIHAMRTEAMNTDALNTEAMHIRALNTHALNSRAMNIVVPIA